MIPAAWLAKSQFRFRQLSNFWKVKLADLVGFVTFNNLILHMYKRTTIIIQYMSIYVIWWLDNYIGWLYSTVYIFIYLCFIGWLHNNHIKLQWSSWWNCPRSTVPQGTDRRRSCSPATAPRSPRRPAPGDEGENGNSLGRNSSTNPGSLKK